MKFKDMLNEKADKGDYSLSTKKLGDMILKKLSNIERDVKEQIKYSQNMEDNSDKDESQNSYHVWLKNVYNNLNKTY